MLETGPHRPTTLAASDARTLGDLFRIRASRSGDAPAMYEKRDGSWQKVTWRGFWQAAAMVAKGLIDLGIDDGERVAVLGATKPPWAFYDMGAQLAGFVTLGIYPKQSVEQIRYLLDHSDARVVFVDVADELDHVIEAAHGNDKVVAIVPWSEALYEATKDKDPRVTSPTRFEAEALSEADIDVRLAAIDPKTTAIFIYTSGTTGPPKGAMISHDNILALLSADDGDLEFFQDDLSLSFLPMAHAAERVLAFYGRINSGIATAYATSTATVLTELQEVQPTVFGSVPRIFEKAHGKAYSELAKKPRAVQKLFGWAIKVGTRRTQLELGGKSVPLGLRIQDKIADRLVFSKVRKAFGGRVRMFITGAAPIADSIMEFFWACRLPIYEAYGMTEATVMTHINRPGKVRLGSVGQIIAPLEQKIAEDGEILIKGPWVFMGYFKAPEATASTVIDDWLHTGDIGKIDEDGYLYITDRKKHLIITAGGKNLAPANIQKAIRESDPIISQVHAHGDRRPFISAIVAPSPIETLEFGLERGLVSQAELDERTRELMDNPTGRSGELEASMAKVTMDDAFKARVQAAVAKGNGQLARVEQVRKFMIIDRDFSQEHGELTPTMKLKRKTIEETFKPELDKIYGEGNFGLEPRLSNSG